jgi:glucose-6-phosphate 1-dehydrogenase
MKGSCFKFAAKVPGLGIDVRPVNMDFAYGSAFTVESPDAYETLILDALLGDASLFTRADEVEAAWRIVDPIIDAWIAGPEPEMPNYTAGTWGLRQQTSSLHERGAAGAASKPVTARR